MTYLSEQEFGTEMQPTIEEREALKAAGFEDDSWHNDICPSFRNDIDLKTDTCVKIWVDAINPADREMTTERFMVAVYQEMECMFNQYTESLEEAIKLAEEMESEYYYRC